MDVKVEIYKDKMELIHGDINITVHPLESYTTSRLLVGTFLPAVDCLRQGLKQIGASGLLKPKPAVYIQACDKAEGGLSEVEEKCLIEVALAAGARKAELI